MTIGIAAYGPGAAAAIVAALRAAEAFSFGAIGGFVSLAAIVDGRIERAAVQVGGATALFPDGAAAWLATARCAALMSSGPNRPDPLDQFTPGDPRIGLMTGHRFPNSPDRQGRPLNQSALALMGSGHDPQSAVDGVASTNPDADAGLLAITPHGHVGLADCAYLDQFSDRGHAILNSAGGIVAVTHNGISPHRGLALIVAELALSRMLLPQRDPHRIEVRAGIPLRPGPRNAVEVDNTGRATGLRVSNPTLLNGTNSFGLGYQAEVIGAQGNRLQYEPYMVCENGVLLSIDGASSAWLAVA